MSAKVKDKATAFKHELVGSTTNKIVCKASSHEIAGPKKKHVDCKHINQTVAQMAYYVWSWFILSGSTVSLTE